MPTIDFLPERLNRPPVVFRGLTSGELFMAMAAGAAVGLALGIVLALMFSLWAIAPTLMIICGLMTIFASGKFLARLKRGRSEMWLYRAVQMRLSQSPLSPLFSAFGLADRDLILKASYWSARRK